jgi:hypothetical protein
MDLSMPEWEQYCCKIPKPDAGFERKNCSHLHEVHHVAHISDACRIIEDGKLKAGLVYDESRLNTTRTSVTWLSPNTWAPGSIYGTVQFTFNWSDVLGDRSVYWVEAITRYRPSAYRFLLTDRQLTAADQIQAYDAKKEEGPLRYRNGAWYWNESYSCEFMLDAQLSLKYCQRVEFVKHRPDICRLFQAKCPELQLLPQKVGARVLAHVLGRHLESVDHALLASTDSPRSGQLSMHANEVAVGGIWFELAQGNPFGGPASGKQARPVLEGALVQLSAGNRSGARELVALLKSDNAFEKALEEIVSDHFDMPGYRLPD